MLAAAASLAASSALAQFRITEFSRSGDLSLSETYTQGVCTVESASVLTGNWTPEKNMFTTNTEANIPLPAPASTRFRRVLARDIGDGSSGFTNLIHSYGLLTTIAGAGGPQDTINWRPEYRGRTRHRCRALEPAHCNGRSRR